VLTGENGIPWPHTTDVLCAVGVLRPDVELVAALVEVVLRMSSRQDTITRIDYGPNLIGVVVQYA
jgi:hypothetical protein